MTESTKSNGFNPVNLIGIVWSVHILIAALIYPSYLLPKDNDPDKLKGYKITSLVFGTFLLLINILVIIVMFTRSTWLDTGKIVFIAFIWLAVGTIYILFNHLNSIYQFLAVLEEEAIEGRDQSIMVIRAGQAALQAGNKRLFAEPEMETSFMVLLKKFGPLALLFLQKEKNILQIALTAGKAFFTSTRWFKTLY